MRVIAIYDDDGVSSRSCHAIYREVNNLFGSQYSVIYVDREFVAHGEFSNLALFIMPGGRAKPYHMQLAGAAEYNLRHYVANGGRYLGLCAGAYYASRYTEFAIGHSLEITSRGELDFFPGYAIGPAYGIESFAYDSTQGAKLVTIHSESKLFSKDIAVYYNGGCYFDVDNLDGCEVLAGYTDLGQAAVVRCFVGSGQVILSGVHPEIAYYDVDKDDKHVQTFYDLFNKTELARIQLMQSMLNLML